MTLSIRPYRSVDRVVIRTIACDTADLGEPVERFFRDREVFADLVTRYYTDWEPHSVWVAEQDGEVVGYLTGCLDTRQYHLIMAVRIVSHVILKALRRWTIASPHTWRILSAGLQTLLRGGLNRSVPLAQYPAHLHVNVKHGFRGQQVGHQLMERFFSQAQQAGAKGIHAAVRADNTAACRFFERCGFHVLSRHPIVAYDGTSCQRRETAVYGKTL